MKRTQFIQKILSALTAITFVSLSGNMAFAGIDLVYPGGELNSSGSLLPEGSNADNRVTVIGGVASAVYGAVAGGNGVATNNTVTISGGEIRGGVYGASAGGNGVATNNTVTILDGNITGGVDGGWVTYDGETTNNTVMIKGGTIRGGVIGGTLVSGLIMGNSVIISGGKIGGAMGGYSYGGSTSSILVTGNAVTILGGEIRGGVYGGRSSSGGVVTGNAVTILGGKITGFIYGGYAASGETTGNIVDISGGEMERDVYGGYSFSGVVTGNTVKISGGEIVQSVNGGYAENSGVTTDNIVDISGGKIGGDVYAGFSSQGETTGNTVTISGGEIGGDVIGGKSHLGAATENTVILDSGAVLSSNSAIFGGFSGGEGVDAFSGNKLVLNDFQGTVKQIANFEFIDITSSGKEGDMLTLAGGVATDLSQSKVNITFTGISRPFHAGDKINLIKNEAGITMGSGTLLQEGQNKVQGTFYIYDVLFGSDENSIYATVEEKKVNDRSKALAEGRVASMAHLNMGADLIAGQGMAQALDSDKLKGRIHLFSAMAATNSQYDTGSHVDLYGYSALVGASLAPAALPSLNCGVFAESGWGNYGSFSDFEDGAVRGSGSTQYYGGGLLTHYDFTKMGVKGLTVEASFRAGKTDADYQSGDLANSQYDLSTPYYGVHTSVDYTRQLSAKLKIANYARFFWSHMDGDNTTIEGSDLRFRTMDSQRIKAGSRLFYEPCDCLTPYAGLSYEWECSGTSRAVVDGVNGIAAPSLRGGTGTGELGAVWKPMAHQAFWVDFSVQGHVGNRQGVSGVVRLRAEF